jgi:hypothetical protein
MKPKTILTDETLINKIYVVRGHNIMLDRDLAELYGVKAIRLREQVKRNEDKFPSHFMFRLTDEEADVMVSQFAIPSKQHLGGFLPYVFTEHGVLQLANVLKSKQATEMSIKLIEIFVRMRQMILTHKDLLIEMEEIRKKVSGQDAKIELIFSYLKQFVKEQQTPRPKIGFKK